VLKKIVIVAEGAAGAGLTEDAGFPMMKNQPKFSPRRHGGTEARRTAKSLIFGVLCFCVSLSLGFSVALCLRGGMIFLCALLILNVFPA